MGNCCASSEYRTYARGEDPSTLTFQYQNAVNPSFTPPTRNSTGVNSHRNSLNRSTDSLHSLNSESSKRSNTKQTEQQLLLEMKNEVEALKRRKAFLENIKQALEQLQVEEENESQDSEEENAEFQQKFKKEVNMKNRVSADSDREMNEESGNMNNKNLEKEKGLRKLENFNMKQFKRKSVQRVKNLDSNTKLTRVSKDLSVSVSASKDTSTAVSKEELVEEDIMFPVKLDGESSRSWTNSFATRLGVVRKFYEWDDIPLDFFVDKHVQVTSRPTQLNLRERLSARLAERRALEINLKDNRKSVRRSLKRGDKSAETNASRLSRSSKNSAKPKQGPRIPTTEQPTPSRISRTSRVTKQPTANQNGENSEKGQTVGQGRRQAIFTSTEQNKEQEQEEEAVVEENEIEVDVDVSSSESSSEDDKNSVEREKEIVERVRRNVERQVVNVNRRNLSESSGKSEDSEKVPI